MTEWANVGAANQRVSLQLGVHSGKKRCSWRGSQKADLKEMYFDKKHCTRLKIHPEVPPYLLNELIKIRS